MNNIFKFIAVSMLVLAGFSSLSAQQIFATIEKDAAGDFMLRIKDYMSAPEKDETTILYVADYSNSFATANDFCKAWGFNSPTDLVNNQYFTTPKYAKVELSESVKPKSLNRWFAFFKGIEEIQGIETINTEETTDMYGTFSQCHSLQNLDIRHFVTDKVTTMQAMFQECMALEELDLSGFNTELVTNMSYMFKDCKNLTYLDLGSFNTAKVTTFQTMFQGANALEYLDLGSFSTENLTNCSHMFQNMENGLQIIFVGSLAFSMATAGTNGDMFSNVLNLTGYEYGVRSTIPVNPSDAGAIGNSKAKCAENNGYFTYKEDSTIGIGIKPTKLKYDKGETKLDLTGGYITKIVKYGFKQTLKLKLISLDYIAETMQGFDTQTDGVKTLTFTYGGNEYSYDIYVGDVEIPEEPKDDPENPGEDNPGEGGEAPGVGNEELECGSFALYTNANTVVFNGVENKTIEIYSISGSLLRREVASSNAVEINMPKSGAYVARVSGVAKKFVIL